MNRFNEMAETVSIEGLNELTQILYQYNLNKNDIILVGSVVLAFNNIRKNNDIEFIICPEKYKKIPFKYRVKLIGWGHISLLNNVDLFHNFCWPCGVKDKVIFKKKLYDSIEGWNVLNLKYEYWYKIFLLKYLGKRDKDICDIRYIEERIGNQADIIEINRKVFNFIKIKDMIIKQIFCIRDIYNRIWKKRK